MKNRQFIEDLKSGVFANMVREEMINEKFNNSKEVYNTLKPLMAMHSDVEKLYVIFLNAKNSVLDIVPMFSGSITGSPVFPREIIKAVLERKAVAVIIAHNHPSGDCKPSREDISTTKKIQFALTCVNATLHDHIIVGSNGEFFSFAESHIPRFQGEMIDFFNSN